MGSKRITEKDLRELCELLNQATDSPLTAYSEDENGELQRNAGHYYLSYAYGGVQLQRISPKGGCETPLGGGYCTKRELFGKMQSYLFGMAAGYSMVEK